MKPLEPTAREIGPAMSRAPRAAAGSPGAVRASDADPSDDELVVAARCGDAQAFEVLLNRHQGTVLRVLSLMGVPAQDRDDVAQEVFVRIFRHLGGFRHGRPMSSWVYRIAVNASHDHRARRRRDPEEAPADEAWDGGPSEGGPHHAAEQRDLRTRLLRALAVLTERERAVFVLRELEGLETGAVSRALGITGVTVRRHLGRARRRLQQTLQSDA